MKIDSVLYKGGVKLHFFEPSGRRIWTVVGEEKEYWLNPDLDFCSCLGFHFCNDILKSECYHLKALKTALKENKMQTIVFTDEEYDDFIAGLVDDL